MPSAKPKKTSTTVLILLVILGILAALGVRLWASGQAQAITGPTSLRLGDDGQVYAIGDRQLLVFSEGGDLLERIPLARFGLDEFVGDFWVKGVSGQQEILLRAPRPEGGIARWLRVQLRIGGDGRDQMPAGQAALRWCPLAGGACRPFGPDFRSTRTFRLAVEAATGAVLIADTAQHRLLRLDAQGKLQATSPQNFEFPNGMVFGRDGLLYVADTNHHRIAAVNPGIQGFGEVRHAFNVEVNASSPDRKWPMGLVQAPDGAFWTINAASGMAFGDLIVYEEDGRVRQKLDQAIGADPLSLLLTKDRVLVADPHNFRIGTFDLEGKPRRAFGDEAFSMEMAERQRQRKRFEATSTWALLAIAMLTLAAFLIQRRQRTAS